MREKTRRIVKYGWGSTRISRKWKLAVALLTLLAVTGTSFGQWYGYEQEGIHQMEYVKLREQQEQRERQELAREGRRQVLDKLLEQLRTQAEQTEKALEQQRTQQEQGAQGLRTKLENLQEQIRQTETALREHHEKYEKQAQVLQGKLEALHQQMRAAEEQLQAPPMPGPPPPPPGPAPVEQLHERLRDLDRQADKLRQKMKELDDADHPEARELRDALKRTNLEKREIQEQLEQRQREKAPREPQPPKAPRQPAGEPRGNVREFLQHCRELKAEIERTEIDLWELHERGKIGRAETHELAQVLHTLHAQASEVEQRLNDRIMAGEIESLHKAFQDVRAQMKEIRTNLADLKRGQQELRETQGAEVDKLRAQMNGLQKSTQETNKLLQELLTMDSPATVGSAGQYWRY